MPIPYHRYVRYTDDGCGIHECLNCKATWEWRGGSGCVRYCMYCGVEFQGERECRDHEMPRWRYDLLQRIGEDRYYAMERSFYPPRPEEPYWVIEERTFHVREGGEELMQDWHQEQSLHYRPHLTAQEAFALLQQARAEANDLEKSDDDDDFSALPRWFRYEYRLVRKHHDSTRKFRLGNAVNHAPV